MILVIAATERELAGAGETPTLACGIGPVEAAATTARALTVQQPEAVLHVGIAGARGIPAPQLVIGSESIYEDAAEGGLVTGRVCQTRIWSRPRVEPFLGRRSVRSGRVPE